MLSKKLSLEFLDNCQRRSLAQLMSNGERHNLGVVFILIGAIALNVLIRMPASQNDGFHNGMRPVFCTVPN